MAEENRVSLGIVKANALRQILNKYNKEWQPIMTFVANGWIFLGKEDPRDSSEINAFLSYQIGHLRKYLTKQHDSSVSLTDRATEQKAPHNKKRKIKLIPSTAEVFDLKEKPKFIELLAGYNALIRKMKGSQPRILKKLDFEEIKEVIALVEELTALKSFELQKVSQKRKTSISLTQESPPPKICRQETPPTPIIENILEKADEENEMTPTSFF